MLVHLNQFSVYPRLIFSFNGLRRNFCVECNNDKKQYKTQIRFQLRAFAAGASQ